ncbi:MAG: nuclear transport factor 2 family protein [Actinobacteria bacterium]|nr:nuclear transport factor 2 family protein [Actinomycetota bacterium]
MRTEQEQENLEAVLDFYHTVINGQQYERAMEFLDDNYIQHKPEVETGLQGVLDFVRHVYEVSPTHEAIIVRSFVDGDFVILHVHIKNGAEAKDIAVMDIFRVQDGKLMEHWDVAQPVPADFKHANGMF